MYKILITSVLLVGCAKARYEYKPADGLNGVDGSSCSTQQLSNGAVIRCTDGTVSVVYNGASGSNGTNGTNGAGGLNGVNGRDGTNGINGTNSILEVVNPCGVEFANEEVFLRMSSGQLLALYDGGANLDRLVLIAPGNYITTDAVQNRSCSFTVTTNNQIINEVRN